MSSSLLSSTPDRAEEQDWMSEFVSDWGLLSPGVVVSVRVSSIFIIDWLDRLVTTMLSLGVESMDPEKALFSRLS